MVRNEVGARILHFQFSVSGEIFRCVEATKNEIEFESNEPWRRTKRLSFGV
ncbi:hypothetical protein ISS04_04070 [Candidatus Woesearchaeota archaeon]|nr:hypothetical protein [Candidatus Woesearchaeota archaeon]